MDSQQVISMIDSEAFTLRGFKDLSALLVAAALAEEGTSRSDALSRATRSWNNARVLRARKAAWHCFEGHPIFRELDIIGNKKDERLHIKPRKRRPRKFSVFPEELPIPWQEAFQSMEEGHFGAAGTVPVPSMIITMKTKAAEFIKAADDAGAPRELCVQSAISYEQSLNNRASPLSKKTLLSALRQMRDFARYVGCDDAVLAHFAERIRVHENRSNGSLPQKEAKVLKLPTYDEIFGMALDLLGKAAESPNPRIAQAHRNTAVAITLLCPFPFRVADTKIRFGRELLWDGTHYRFNLQISKSRRNFSAYVLPVFGFFIDQLVLQGSTNEHLEDLRNDCIARRRLLFVKYNDQSPDDRYVSYLWSRCLGMGSHAARTHLHDSFGRLGARGVELAMRACDHRSEKTAEAYRTRAFELLSKEAIHNSLADFTDQEWQEFFGSDLQ